MALETEPEENTAAGKPNIKTYLETGLSESVQKAIKDYLQGEKEQVLEWHDGQALRPRSGDGR